MTRHVVIGTAGHVDHGKTALVRALTGVDTDRWEEEKRRGITIDLGFAPLDLGDGIAASVVDVPGHEDFVRNMVAGATGIDLALLVVAADEGVMPQTIEHVAILDALGVSTGVVAIAKTDLVEPAWLDLVAGDIRERLAGSTVAWRELVPVSAQSGSGLDALRTALRAAAGTPPLRAADDVFRLPVDRAFSVAGAGTVVTGTAWSGSVRPGDEVSILPGGHRARVRGVQVHDTPEPMAVPGRRTALALVGIERDAAPRGATVVAGPGWRATTALDVLVTLLPDAPPLEERSRVRLHLGTAEVLARVTPAADAIRGGTPGMARLRLEAPIAARWGDRGVLRSFSPVTTIGGCVVADPWPAGRPRRPHGLDTLLAPLPDRVVAAVGRSGAHGLAVADLPVRLGIAPPAVQATIAALGSRGVQRIGERLIQETAVRRGREQLLAALAEFHRKTPLAAGLPLEGARHLLRDAEVADAVIAGLATEGKVVVDGATVRLATHQPRAAAGGQELVGRVGNALRDSGFEGRTVPELSDVGSPGEVGEVVDYLLREGRVVRVGRDRYYDTEILSRMVQITAGALAETGEVSVAQLRDKLGLTRKYLIPFLEWLDARGYTVRRGDVRRSGPGLTKGSTAL